MTAQMTAVNKNLLKAVCLMEEELHDYVLLGDPSEILLPSTARNWQDGHSDKLAQTASYAGHQVNCGWFQFQSGTVTIGYKYVPYLDRR